MPKNKNTARQFPYKTTLDLSLLVKYWKDNLSNTEMQRIFPTKDIIDKIDAAESLHHPITDTKELKQHKELVGFLMSAIFPPATLETKTMAALQSFSMNAFYATPNYLKFIPMGKDFNPTTNILGDDIYTGKVIHACMMILKKYYGVAFEKDRPLIFTFKDPDTGLDRNYKAEFNDMFLDVVCTGELPVLDKKDINLLLSNLYDVTYWLKYLPQDLFEFNGFMVFELLDVTDQEMLSSIKYDLLQKGAILSEERFSAIQQKIRALFRLPLMRVGIAAFNANSSISNYGNNIWKSILLESQNEFECKDYQGSIYEMLFVNQKAVIVEDIEALPNKTVIEKALLKSGIKNIAIAPLTYDGEVIGILELGTPYVGKLNPVSAGKAEDVLPMFSTAIKRVLVEMETDIRAIIQEEFTAIHPTVEWKFIEASAGLMQKRLQGQKAIAEDIVFEEVYPLYGMADVRGSSSERNLAIQQDLIDNLELADKVVSDILAYKNMPILDEIKFRLKLEIDKIKEGLNSGDEVGVLDFLKKEIVPLFQHFKEEDIVLKPIIEEYEKNLNPQLGIIYNKRKDYEDSITAINHTIADYLDGQQVKAQEVFPHYFEMYKTDGVEYNLYLGQSLVKDRPFDPVYLKNFRLWQLITMCEVANELEGLKKSLAKPLDIAQLILVHSEPIAIRFRMDEKQFDVDGAYNIRYEIVKKRIDKALIMGTNERLTQPGKIAIVYAQVKEAEEYLQFVRYLQSTGYLNEEVEMVELENLQGAQGLKAIRVSINLKAAKKNYGNKMIEEVVASLQH
jgi:hypothetical protein